LKSVSSFVAYRPRLLFSLSDLKLPEYLDFPSEFQETDPAAFDLLWQSPWVVVRTRFKSAWRMPGGQGTSGQPELLWRYGSGSLLGLSQNGQFVFFDGGERVSSVEPATGKMVWAVSLPEVGVEKATVAKTIGHLWAVSVSGSAPGPARVYWLDTKLGAWVHQSTLVEVESIQPPTESCPKPSGLPDYGSLVTEDGKLWCFQHGKRAWVAQPSVAASQPTPQTEVAKKLESDEGKMAFWRDWFAVMPARAPLIQKKNQKIYVSAFFKSETDRREVDWYLDRLCGRSRCDLETHFRSVAKQADEQISTGNQGPANPQ
jgi:hypothetical protein